MKFVPNMLLINVPDMAKGREFYESLFDISAFYEGDHFTAYGVAPGFAMALQTDWSEPERGRKPNSELCMNVTISSEEIDALYADWLGKGATEVEAPHQAVYGYTFLVADPFGNVIRVAPDDDSAA